MFLYKIDILDTLKEKGYNTNRLKKRKATRRKCNTINTNNKIVGMSALEKICSLLDCQPGDLIEYRKE